MPQIAPRKPSLAAAHPELARQWHPTKNGDRRPKDFTTGSKARVWWLCLETCSSCGSVHEWQAIISNRTKAGNPTGCPFCYGLSICRCSSLAATQPELMAQWDHAGNEGLDPSQIGVSSRRKVSWVCTQHGTWLARVSFRVAGSACPKCSCLNHVQTRRGLLWDEHPELVAQLHPTKNEHLDLDKVTSGSKRKAVWVCHDRKNAPPGCTHAHEWSATIVNRTNLGSGCPYCSGLLVCPCNSLAVRAPEVAAQWHPTYNGDKLPDQVGAHSSLIIWWQHVNELTGEVHEWKAAAEDRMMAWEIHGRLSCRQCRSEEQQKLIKR